jgi:hypothetical protein
MFNLTSPADEVRLRAEAEQFEKQRLQSREEAIAGAAAAVAGENQAADAEERDFAQFHKAQNITRAQNRFLAAHDEYVNSGSNAAKFVQWMTERGIDEPTADVYEEAYADLNSRHELELKGPAWHSELHLDNMSAEKLYEEHQKAQQQAEADEAEDRAVFEKGEARGAYRWLREHPEFIQSPENIAQFQLYFNARRIDLNRASVAQIEEAYQAIKGQLKLRKVEPQSFESEQSLYDMDLSELERRAGGRQNDGRQYSRQIGYHTEPDDYVPLRSNVRPGDFSTVESDR